MANALRNLANRAVDLMKDESTGIAPAAAEPSPTAVPVPLCSKCGKNPRADADGTNPWCKECRAAYQRDYEERRLARKESRGFALGVAMMRADLARKFDAIGFSRLEAWEVRDAILQAPAPSLPDED